MKKIILLMILAAPLAAQDEHLVQGKAVFDKWCAPCHDAGEKDHPGTLALSIKYQGQKSPVIAEWTDLTEELTRYYVRNGVSVMPHFRKTEINDEELAALAAYLARNMPGK